MGYPEGYDPAAAEDSFVRVRRFLDQWLRKPGTSK
jgi:hypothetical protein